MILHWKPSLVTQPTYPSTIISLVCGPTWLSSWQTQQWFKMSRLAQAKANNSEKRNVFRKCHTQVKLMHWKLPLKYIWWLCIQRSDMFHKLNESQSTKIYIYIYMSNNNGVSLTNNNIHKVCTLHSQSLLCGM